MSDNSRFEWEKDLLASDLAPRERLVALTLATHWPNCEPSVARLCSLSGYGERSVQGGLAELERTGWITRVDRSGSGKATLYGLTTPPQSLRGTPRSICPHPPAVIAGDPPQISTDPPQSLRGTPRRFRQEPPAESAPKETRVRDKNVVHVHADADAREASSAQMVADLKAPLAEPPEDASFPGWPTRRALPPEHPRRADAGPEGQDRVDRWWTALAGHPHKLLPLKLYLLRAYTADEWRHLVEASSAAQQPLSYARAVAQRLVREGGVDPLVAPPASAPRSPEPALLAPYHRIYEPPAKTWTAEDRRAMLAELELLGELPAGVH